LVTSVALWAMRACREACSELICAAVEGVQRGYAFAQSGDRLLYLRLLLGRLAGGFALQVGEERIGHLFAESLRGDG
jgi:hypothetical protein